MKAVLQYRASPGFQELLARRTPDWLEILVIMKQTNKLSSQQSRIADVLLHVLEPVTSAVIQAAPRLQLIQKIGVGVNTIDVQAAQQRGIAVANMPGTNTTAVVEMTLLLMLATLRRVTAFDTATRQGQGWQAELSRFDTLGEISGQAIGLVGTERLPRVWHLSCKCLGLQCCIRPGAKRRKLLLSGVLWPSCSQSPIWSRSICH